MKVTFLEIIEEVDLPTVVLNDATKPFKIIIGKSAETPGYFALSEGNPAFCLVADTVEQAKAEAIKALETVKRVMAGVQSGDRKDEPPMSGREVAPILGNDAGPGAQPLFIDKPMWPAKKE